MDSATAIQDWLFETIANRFAATWETATGERSAMQWERVSASPPEPADSGKQDLRWRQSFQFPPGAIWITAAAEAWNALGGQILAAAGQQERGEDAAKSAYLELVSQAITGVAEHLSGRLRDEAILGPGEEVPVAAGLSHRH